MRADYLTMTYFDETLDSVALSRASGEPLPRSWYGANGYYYETCNVYVGRYADGRRIINVSGKAADDIAREVLPRVQGDFSVARIDLQVTVAVPDANAVVESLKPHPRYRSVLVRALDPKSGSTLYVGAPASRKRLRIYNKSKQANLNTGAGELLRVELVARDANADLFGWRWRHAGREGAADLFRGNAISMCRDLDHVLPRDVNKAHIDVPEVAEKTRYEWWLEHSVIPGVQKAIVSRNPQLQDVLKRLRDVIALLDREKGA